MKMTELIIKEIHKIFSQRTEVKRVILFGSYSNRLDTPKSDIDLCVVVTSDSEKEQIAKLLFDFGLQHNVLIHTILMSLQEFNSKLKIKIYKEAFITNGKTIIKRSLK